MTRSHSRRHTPDNCLPLVRAMECGKVTMQARARGHYPGQPLAADALPGLRSVGYWDAVGKPDWGLPWHRNEGIEICCMLTGQTVFATDSDRVLLRSGDVTITRPWQRHRLGDPNIRASRLFWLILDVEGYKSNRSWEFPDWIAPDARSRREIQRIFRVNQLCHLPARDFSLRDYLQEATARIGETGPLANARLAGILNHFVLEVAALLLENEIRTPVDPHGFNQTIRSFFAGLEQSPDAAAEPWTVAAIARSCRVGVTYLTKITKELYNATPAGQLCRIRLEHAARMLETLPHLTITEIAFMTGFNSSQYFATCFRRFAGCSPGDYRLRSAAGATAV